MELKREIEYVYICQWFLSWHLFFPARIGAIHSVVFNGFSSKSLSDRINDADCNILITADGGFRGDKVIPLKNISDDLMKNVPSIEKCIVLKRTNTKHKYDEWKRCLVA